MLKIQKANVYDFINFDFPSDEELSIMSIEDKKSVYLEGLTKIVSAIKMLAGFPDDPDRNFMLCNLHFFKLGFTAILMEYGLTNEEIDKKLIEINNVNKAK